MKLKGNALGFAMGIIWGGTVFLATIILLIKANFQEETLIGPHIALLAQFYFGYTVTWWGSVVGFIYGFINGYIGGLIFAWIYNRFANAEDTGD